MRAIGAAMVLVAFMAGCGGGSGGGATGASSTAAAGAQVQDPGGAPAAAAGSAPASAAPATQLSAQRPDLQTATQAQVLDWNSTCITEGCQIVLPARSGRSLNWWGTDPRLVEQVNETCGPQPDCRVPDGDLLVWNFACTPQPACRIRLSRTY